MIIHHAKHLEPIKIGYNNETKNILVTEDGSKFYPSDLVFHKSIDILFQKMDTKEKELFLLLCERTDFTDSGGKITFYLSEKEFNDYCGKCSKYFETSDSVVCREVKKRLLTKKGNCEFKNWAEIERLMDEIQNVDVGKLMKYWKSRAAANGKGVSGRVFVKTMTTVQLAGIHIEKSKIALSSFTMFQQMNIGRTVILKTISDQRSENNEHWLLYFNEVSETYFFILEKEGRLKEHWNNVRKWRHPYDEEKSAAFITIKDFEKYLEIFQIDKNQIILVPEMYFAVQWITLPLSVGYTCATVLDNRGRVGYKTIQAQFRIFQMLVCDFDWFAGEWLYQEEWAFWRLQVIQLMKRLEITGFYKVEKVQLSINTLLREGFFTTLKKMNLKTPLSICRKKSYNDFMPMEEFKKLVESHGCYIPAEFDIDFESDRIAIWKVRYIFLIHWIRTFLHDEKQLIINLMAALTMSFEFQMIDEDKDLDDPSKYWIDVKKYKLFEEKVERKRVEELVEAQKLALNVKQGLVETSDEKEPAEDTITDGVSVKTVEDVGVSKLENCKGCEDKNIYTNEVSDLKRQVAEKSKLLEDQRKQIQQLFKDLEHSQKATENTEMEKNNLKEQLSRKKQECRESLKRQKIEFDNKKGQFERLETELRENGEVLKNELIETKLEAEKEVKSATDKLKKKENELEKLKLAATMNSKELINLKKENDQLKRQVEINKDEMFREISRENEKLKLENRRILEDKCVRDQEVEFLKIENIKLKQEKDQLSLTVGTDHSSTSSEVSPIKNAPSTSREFTP